MSNRNNQIIWIRHAPAGARRLKRALYTLLNVNRKPKREWQRHVPLTCGGLRQSNIPALYCSSHLCPVRLQSSFPNQKQGTRLFCPIAAVWSLWLLYRRKPRMETQWWRSVKYRVNWESIQGDGDAFELFIMPSGKQVAEMHGRLRVVDWVMAEANNWWNEKAKDERCGVSSWKRNIHNRSQNTRTSTLTNLCFYNSRLHLH